MSGWETEESMSAKLLALRNALALAESSLAEKQAFLRDPRQYLESLGIGDVVCHFGDSDISFSRAVASADEDARLAVARAIFRRMTYGANDEGGIEPQGIPLALAFPVVNALIVGNVVLMTNAVANMITTTNVSGRLSSCDLQENRPRQVLLGDSYRAGAVFKKLDEMGYSEARQAVLLREIIDNKSDVTDDKNDLNDAVCCEESCEVNGLIFKVIYRSQRDILIIDSGTIDDMSSDC